MGAVYLLELSSLSPNDIGELRAGVCTLKVPKIMGCAGINDTDHARTDMSITILQASVYDVQRFYSVLQFCLSALPV